MIRSKTQLSTNTLNNVLLSLPPFLRRQHDWPPIPSFVLTMVLVCCMTLSEASLAESDAILPDEDQCRQYLITPTTPNPVLGWCLTIDQNKGNCLACHAIRPRSLDGKRAFSWPELLAHPGNIAMPLSKMKATYPDKKVLFNIIHDSRTSPDNRPFSMMPPFGQNMILSDGEISLIVEFLHTL